MGLSTAPDVFQSRMSSLMSGVDYVRVYLDDLLVLSSGSYEDHLEKLSAVLDKLFKAGLRVQTKNAPFVRLK